MNKVCLATRCPRGQPSTKLFFKKIPALCMGSQPEMRDRACAWNQRQFCENDCALQPQPMFLPSTNPLLKGLPVSCPVKSRFHRRMRRSPSPGPENRKNMCFHGESNSLSRSRSSNTHAPSKTSTMPTSSPSL